MYIKMSLIPIVSIVGKSNAGKTTFLEKLIRELKEKNYRVGTVKHDAHRFDIDHRGKDSWRHAQAGADTVVISSPEKLALITTVEKEKNLDEITAMISNVDIILTEGYKYGDKPKIEIFRKAAGHRGLISDKEELVAVVSDVSWDFDVPVFDLEDATGVANLLEERFLQPYGGSPENEG